MKQILRFMCWFIICTLGLTACQTTIRPDTALETGVLDPANGVGIWGEITLTPEEEAWLAKDFSVTVRVGPWPPFMFTDSPVRGLAVEYLSLILNRFDIRYRYITEQDASWSEAVERLKHHTGVDLVPTINRTPERERFIRFTQDYLLLPWVIFTRRDSDFIGGMDDLTGKIVSVERGYVMHENLVSHSPGIHLKVVDSSASALRALATGQVDAYVGNLAVGTYLIESRGLTNLKVAAPTPFGSHDQAMGVRDDWPELASLIDKALETMTPEQHAVLRQRWLSVRYEHGIRMFDVIKWVLIVLGSALILLGGIVRWNRRLAKEIADRRRAEEKNTLAEKALKEYSEQLEQMVEERTHELRETQEKLVRQGKLAALGQMAGSIAHELRHPLGVLLNAAYFLNMSLTGADDTIKEYLAIMMREVQKSDKIIADLLNFSRNQRVVKNTKVATQASDLLSEVLAEHPPPESVELVWKIAPELPPISVDPQQIEQVLANLIVNAYQAMLEGGRLTISAVSDKTSIRILVTDTGCGIAPEYMEELFEPLFTTKQKGIGLGLAICKNLAEANGARIDVESKIGQGSTFTISLPVEHERFSS